MNSQLATTRDLNLTDQRKAFVDAFVRHCDPVQAALDAGYSAHSAKRIAYALLQQPAVSQAIAASLQRQIPEGTAIGYKVLREIAEDKRSPAAARVTAARTLAEIGGLLNKRSADSKPIEEMTGDELRGVVKDIERELSDRAKPVNEPMPAQPDTQLADLIE